MLFEVLYYYKKQSKGKCLKGIFFFVIKFVIWDTALLQKKKTNQKEKTMKLNNHLECQILHDLKIGQSFK